MGRDFWTPVSVGGADSGGRSTSGIGRRRRGEGRSVCWLSPNLTLSINLTSSSRRKGPVCPGTMPDSWRVQRRAHPTPLPSRIPGRAVSLGTYRVVHLVIRFLLQPFHLPTVPSEPPATRSSVTFALAGSPTGIVRMLLLAPPRPRPLEHVAGTVHVHPPARSFLYLSFLRKIHLQGCCESNGKLDGCFGHLDATEQPCARPA